MIAALSFAPLPLYLARRADPELAHAPLVHVEDGRVLHANALARRRGISAGMLLDGARLRVEGLRVTEVAEPDLQYGWQEILRELYTVTPWLESPRRGLALATVTPAEATRLARRFDVGVGVARSCEMAELAALATGPGTCRRVPPTAAGEAAFLARLPLRFLRGVALSARNLTRLEWLGLGVVADLAAWTASQLRSYLAEEGEALIAYLHGPRRDALRPFTPPETIARSLSFSHPVREPHQLVPALDRLSLELERALAGRASQRLTLTARFGDGQGRVSRLSKRPLSEARHIRQQALFALRDSDVAGRHVERLTLELAGPVRMAAQEGLWPRRERRHRALEATFQRFPQAPKRLEWRDPHAQADDLAWRWQPYADDLEAAGAAYAAKSAPQRPPRPGARPARRARVSPPSALRLAATAVPLFEFRPDETHASVGTTANARSHAPTADARHGHTERAPDAGRGELEAKRPAPASAPPAPTATS